MKTCGNTTGPVEERPLSTGGVLKPDWLRSGRLGSQRGLEAAPRGLSQQGPLTAGPKGKKKRKGKEKLGGP